MLVINGIPPNDRNMFYVINNWWPGDRWSRVSAVISSTYLAGDNRCHVRKYLTTPSCCNGLSNFITPAMSSKAGFTLVSVQIFCIQICIYYQTLVIEMNVYQWLMCICLVMSLWFLFLPGFIWLQLSNSDDFLRRFQIFKWIKILKNISYRCQCSRGYTDNTSALEQIMLGNKSILYPMVTQSPEIYSHIYIYIYIHWSSMSQTTKTNTLQNDDKIS